MRCTRSCPLQPVAGRRIGLEVIRVGEVALSLPGQFRRADSDGEVGVGGGEAALLLRV